MIFVFLIFSQETYGEDPFLTGTYASYFVQGLQGSHDRYIQANAGCKHFDAHGGPEDIPESRMGFNAKVFTKCPLITSLFIHFQGHVGLVDLLFTHGWPSRYVKIIK